ncbi:MAG: helix-hairpin-helix domain-containing protein [Thermoleophilaceae bacterium]
MAEQAKWQMVAWAVAAAVLVFLGARVLGQRGSEPESAPPVRVDGGGAGPAARGSSAPGVYVHVAGAVRKPGLYRMPADTRVAAAIQKAGGPGRRANLSGINLAAKVADGQQVVVPGPGAGVAGAGVGAAGSSSAAAGAGPGAAKVSLGSATLEQLDGLDGIGPTLAKRIVDYRSQHGGFRSLEQLQEVDGIGEKRFQALKEALSP